jgi:succinate dehydrogenase / fumarate reductase, flavoprotein subunit
MSESLRNDGRIWVPLKKGDKRPPARFPKPSAIITWSAAIPASATWCRATWLRATPSGLRRRPRRGRDRPRRLSRFRDAIERLGKHVIKERYGNLFDMYERITGEDPYQVPMRIYPAIHYTMGGLWVDYNLMSPSPACS